MKIETPPPPPPPRQHQLDLSGLLPLARREDLRAIFGEHTISLHSCVYWINQAPWSLPGRTCADSFLLFPVRGELEVRLPGTTHMITPGEFLMLAEGSYHALALRPGYEELHQIAIHCHIHDRWGRPLLRRFPSAIGRLEGLEMSAAVQAMREISCLLETDRATGAMRGEGFLRELLATQLAGSAGLLPPPAPGDPRVSHVLDLMEQGFPNPALSVEALAPKVHLTPVHLRKLFRAATGNSPRNHLSQLRLREAERLLRHSALSVKEIAAQTGFATEQYFHQVFRHRHHCTPGQYRVRAGEQV